MNIISLGYPNLLWDWSVLLFNQICLPFCKHLPWPLIFMCAHMLFLFSIICFLNLYVICAVVFIFFTLCLSCLSYFRALYVYIVFICFLTWLKSVDGRFRLWPPMTFLIKQTINYHHDPKQSSYVAPTWTRKRPFRVRWQSDIHCGFQREQTGGLLVWDQLEGIQDQPSIYHRSGAPSAKHIKAKITSKCLRWI